MVLLSRSHRYSSRRTHSGRQQNRFFPLYLFITAIGFLGNIPQLLWNGTGPELTPWFNASTADEIDQALFDFLKTAEPAWQNYNVHPANPELPSGGKKKPYKK